MNGYALKKPVLRCSFTAANGTLPTAYPWTGVGEIRPKIDGVDQQFVIGDAGVSTWDLNTNQIQNRVSAATLVGIKLSSRAKRITLGIENDEVGAVGTMLGVLLRCSDNLATYLQAHIQRTVTGVFNLRVTDQVLNVLGQAAGITPPPAITTRQQMEVIDTGSEIIITFAGNRAVIATTLYNTQQSVGLTIPSASASALQKLDNLEAWV